MEYPKVLTLGSYQTERSLIGPVVVQEKIDGSQFRFWIDDNGEINYGSHHKKIYVGQPLGMFKDGIEYLESIKSDIQNMPKSTFFFCEYLQKPKHNQLKYNTIPKNHFVLFDCYMNNRWVERGTLVNLSNVFNIDIIPELKIGMVTLDACQELLKKDSYLGGEKIEGIVIKNYNETIMVGGILRPAFVKLVRAEFKEQNVKSAVIDRNTLDDYMKSFQSEARWNKAMQTLRENGKLLNDPKDIGPLIAQIHKDISEEEKDNIQHFLYKYFINDILRKSTYGFPEWYKNKLLERLDDGKEN